MKLPNKLTFWFLIVTIWLPGILFSQNKNKFRQLGGAEKRWVLSHVFKAKKAFYISQRVQLITDSIAKTGELKGTRSGGQIDAFRHGLWMVMLSCEIGEKRAKRLGIAHEKKNRKDFEKGRLEEEYIPDKAGMEMDLYNNNVGLNLGKELCDLDEKALINMVKKIVLNGDMKIIKQDKEGNFLDADGNKIPDNQWQGKWVNQRILVPSDQLP